MSDWYLDLIPRMAGERPEDAVERVYPGFLDDGEDDSPSPSPLISAEHGSVSLQTSRWMKSVVEQLLELGVGLTVTRSERKKGRRWPHLIELESETAGLYIKVWQDSIALRPLDYPESDEQWRQWWKVIRHFARQRYVAVFSDGMDIWNVPVSYSAARAREVAAIF